MNEEKLDNLRQELYLDIVNVLSKYTTIPKEQLEGVELDCVKSGSNECDIHVSCLFSLHLKTENSIVSAPSFIQNCNIGGVKNFLNAMNDVQKKLLILVLKDELIGNTK